MAPSLGSTCPASRRSVRSRRRRTRRCRVRTRAWPRTSKAVGANLAPTIPTRHHHRQHVNRTESVLLQHLAGGNNVRPAGLTGAKTVLLLCTRLLDGWLDRLDWASASECRQRKHRGRTTTATTAAIVSCVRRYEAQIYRDKPTAYNETRRDLLPLSSSSSSWLLQIVAVDRTNDSSSSRIQFGMQNGVLFLIVRQVSLAKESRR